MTIAYTGPISGSVATDANGDYAIPNAPDGTYTLTPSRAGYGFYPSDQGATVSGADVLGVDFLAYLTSEGSTVEGTIFDSQSGEGLAGVNLSLGEQEVTTDGDGYYRIEEVSPGDYTLSASLSGYYPHSEPMTIPARSSIRKNLSLTPQAAPGSITVTAVTSKHSGPGKFVYFLDEVDFDQTFTVSVDWGGHPPSHVRFQTSKGSFDEPSGTHTFNMGKDFGPGGRLTVTAISADGTESEPWVADFVVMSNPGITTNLRSVDIGDGFYYTAEFEIGDFINEGVEEDVIPDEIPLFGSKKFAFEWLNFSLSSRVTSAGTADLELSVGNVELSKSKLRLADEELTFAPSLEIEGAYQVDTLSWDWDGYLGISGEAKIQKSWPFVYFPAVFFKLSLQVEANARLGITDWSGTLPDINGSFSLEPYGRGNIGAWISDLFSASGFIGLGAALGLQWPQEPTLDELSLFVDAGIEVYGLLFHWEWPALRWDWELVGDARLGRKVIRKEIPDLKKPGFPKLLPRDYLKRPGYGRFHQRLSLRPVVHLQALPGVSQAPLQSLVFPYSEPNVSSRGDKLYLVWLYDNPARSTMNRTMAVFSSWDGAQWSEPSPIADDGTADFAPQVLVFEDGSAIAAWQDANAVLPDSATLEEMAASMEISVSRYNPEIGQWSSPVRMTANGYLDRTPRLAGSSPSQVVLTWIRNAGNDLLGSAAHPNEIWYATWDGTSWSTPQQIGQIANSLVKTALAFDRTTGVLALSVDLDDTLETKDDQELFALTYRDGAWGPLQRLTHDSLADANPQVAFDSEGHSLLTWLKEDALVYALDLDVANRAVITTPEYSSGVADFRMARSGDGRIGLLWADGSEEGSDLYGAFYDPIFQTWGKHQQMTFDADTERSLTIAFYGDATLVAVYNKVQIGLESVSRTSSSGKELTYAIPKPGETNLYVLIYVTGGDLAIQPGGLQISPANPAPGTAATLSATVTNLGETAAGNIPVTFYRGDPQSGGTALGTAVISGTLAPGTEGTASLGWTVPQTDIPLEIYAVVDPDRQVEDRNRANNLFHDRFIRPDLAIQSANWFPLGTDRVSITARIVNQGVILSPPCQVSFRQGTADGILLGEVDLPLLLKDGFADVNLIWDISQSGPMSPHQTVYVAVDEAKAIEDFDRENNHTALQVAFNQPDITLNPSSVDFGSVSVGSTAEQTVVVRNDGLADLSLGEISAPSAPFGMMTDECSQVTLIPGASCTVTVSFAPTSGGTASGSFEIPSNDSDENQVTVNLSGVGLLINPVALLSLNQTSFHPGDPLRLQAHLLTPMETPPAGAYLFEAKLWLKTPLSPPSDLLSLLDISGPGQVVSFSPGTDQTVDLLNLTVPTDIPTGSYEFGLRLRHPTTGEELNVSLAPFEVLPVGAPSKMKRLQPKALQRLAAVARRGLKLPRVFSAQMPRPSDKTPLHQGLGAVRKGRAGGSLGPWVDRKTGAALVTQPTAHLNLNGASFRVGDPLQLDAQLLTPPEVPPAGNYAFEIKLWLETPMTFPSDLVSIVNLAGPGGVINLVPGFDQTFRVIDTAVPDGVSTGAYEFGVRLLHPITGEELSLEMEPFNVTE